MRYKIACKDMGIDCDFVAHGDTEEEILEKASAHAKEVHGYTDEQLEDPEMVKKVKAAIKEE
jgi:predicted small metal-binding protein